ncbi:MAG: hypothetical protein HQK83_02880 [Fibrobacteria bacterium]|nr:hypothetical protein [Fibrobacteria bacterium]
MKLLIIPIFICLFTLACFAQKEMSIYSGKQVMLHEISAIDSITFPVGTNNPDSGKMKIHSGDLSKDYNNADIDSITFHKKLTPVYVTFYSHNEEDGYWKGLLTNEEAYREYRADLIKRIKIFHEYGIPLNWESDHPVLRAVAAFDKGDLLQETGGKNVVKWMAEDMGIIIDPHGHLSTYNHADLAYLIEQLGATPSKVIGGFAVFQCGESKGELSLMDWERGVNLDKDGNIRGRIYTDYIWRPLITGQPAMIGHTRDDFSSGVWRPGSSQDFMQHQAEGRYIYVGQGYPHDKLNVGNKSSGGADVLYNNAGYIYELTQKIATGVLPAGKMYTASMHHRDCPSVEPDVPSTLEGLRATLEALKPLVASGQVIYMDYESVAELWLEKYNGQPNQVFIDEFSVYPQIEEAVNAECTGGTAENCLVDGCPQGRVCLPVNKTCVPDCRTNSCPSQVPVCDEQTGLCMAQ